MNSLTTSKRREIIHFFEDLTHRMKNNLLSQEEEQRMTECYLSYLYSNHSNHSHHSEKENLKKYIVMGWYVYHTVNNVNNMNNDSDT